MVNLYIDNLNSEQIITISNEEFYPQFYQDRVFEYYVPLSEWQKIYKMRYTDTNGLELSLGDGINDFSNVYINFAQTQLFKTHKDVAGARPFTNTVYDSTDDLSHNKFCHDVLRTIAVANNLDKDETYVIKNRNDVLSAVLIEGDIHARVIQTKLIEVDSSGENIILEKLYDQLMELAQDRFEGISGDVFKPLPFEVNDTIGLKLQIGIKSGENFDYWVQIKLTDGTSTASKNMTTFFQDLDSSKEETADNDILQIAINKYIGDKNKSVFVNGEYPSLTRLRSEAVFDIDGTTQIPN